MRSFGKLHPTQERLLKALAGLGTERPSLRKLGKKIGVASPNTVAHHLKQLERKGYLITQEDGTFEIAEEPVRDVHYVPLYGNAACGSEEFFAEENIEERVPLPARTMRVGADDFLVRARGNSMEPQIHDRDLLLVRPASAAATGQVIVAALDDGVYAKQLVRGKREVFLHSFNRTFPPVHIGNRDLRIIGVVRGVLRGSVR